MPELKVKSKTVKAPGAVTKAAKAPKAPRASKAGAAPYEWVAVAAYYLAEKRGFEPGRELEDWLTAEALFLPAPKKAAARRRPAAAEKPGLALAS